MHGRLSAAFEPPKERQWQENAKRFHMDKAKSQPNIQILQLIDKINSMQKKTTGPSEDKNLIEIPMQRKPSPVDEPTIVNEKGLDEWIGA